MNIGQRLMKLPVRTMDELLMELRRLPVDLAWCYMIIFWACWYWCQDFFTVCSLHHTRGHRYKLL